jgi:hypothetical protein
LSTIARTEIPGVFAGQLDNATDAFTLEPRIRIVHEIPGENQAEDASQRD